MRFEKASLNEVVYIEQALAKDASILDAVFNDERWRVTLVADNVAYTAKKALSAFWMAVMPAVVFVRALPLAVEAMNSPRPALVLGRQISRIATHGANRVSQRTLQRATAALVTNVTKLAVKTTIETVPAAAAVAVVAGGAALLMGYAANQAYDKSWYAATFNKTGWTLLHFAAMGNAKQVAAFLINKGANVDLKDQYGNTFIDIAKLFKHSGFVDMAQALIKTRAEHLRETNTLSLESLAAKASRDAIAEELEEVYEEIYEQMHDGRFKVSYQAKIPVRSIGSGGAAFFPAAVPQLSSFAYGMEGAIGPYVPGDCFFNAVAIGLGQSGHNAVTLRQLTVNEMREHSSQYLAAFSNRGETQIEDGYGVCYQGWRNYLKLIAQPTVWVGELEILALSHALQRPIIVLRHGEIPLRADPVHGREYLTEDKKPIYIGYINNNHYIPLTCPAGKNHSDIMELLLRDFPSGSEEERRSAVFA